MLESTRRRVSVQVISTSIEAVSAELRPLPANILCLRYQCVAQRISPVI